MGDCDDCTRVVLQVPLKPRHGFCVKMVRRLVQKKDVGLLEKEAAERHAATLSTRKHVNNLVAGRAAERVHSKLQV